jgi:hypothetical protein
VAESTTRLAKIAVERDAGNGMASSTRLARSSARGALGTAGQRRAGEAPSHPALAGDGGWRYKER